MHNRPVARALEDEVTDERGAISGAFGPERFAQLLHRGSELLRDGQPAAARDTLEEAHRLHPSNPSARNLLALSYFQVGHLERALVLFEALVLENPASVSAKVNLAVVLLKLGRASAARPLLEQVVRVSPENRRAWGYLGVALEQLGLIGPAEEAFLAGHFPAAAKRLRDRHPPTTPTPEDLPVKSPEPATRSGLTPARRRTLPPDPWTSGRHAAAGTVAFTAVQRFSATLAPPSFAPPAPSIGPLGGTAAPPPVAEEPPTGTPPADVDEIRVEHAIAPPAVPMLPPMPMSQAPKQNRPAVPLLDAALSSLLVVPHEATVVTHPTGLVLVGLVQGAEPSDGGFAARTDAVHAFAGPLRREPLPRRPPPSPEPFRGGPSPFVRVVGTGQLILAPPPHMRLLPLEMNADVAFLREDLVIAFDHGLLFDLGRMRRSGQDAISLVRFRGDGIIVVGLERPFLAYDVHGSESVTLRGDSLIGWIGALTPEPAEELEDGTHSDLFTFHGEGTVLFRAPHAAA